MGRRKKEIVEIESTEELESTVDESAENESAEAELLNDSQTRSIAMTEVEASADPEEENSETIELLPEEEAVEKPKRQRKARKKADAEAVGTEITSASKAEKNLKKEMDAALKALDTSMESMLKQWASVNVVTSSISDRLEKIATQVKSQTGESLEDFLLPKKEEKPSFLTKFAICASVIATLFSVLSLTMSQTARQAILNAEINRSTSIETSRVQNASPEVAFGNYRRSDKSRNRK